MKIMADPVLDAYGGTRLHRGEFLRNQSLTSASGRCTVQNAFKETTLYDNVTGEVLWAAPIRYDYGTISTFALGLDGDLVVWNRYRVALWSSGTAGRGVETLEVRDDGQMVLLDGAGNTVWSVGTHLGPSAAMPSPGRGAVLRRGQTLRRQSLTSDDGSTVFFHSNRNVQLIDPDGDVVWNRGCTAEGAHVVLDENGMLRIRAGDGAVLDELAGPGEELVVVRGSAQLRDAMGVVVWTTADDPIHTGLIPRRPPTAPPGPTQSQLEVWIDSLTAGRGYSAAVVLDVEPAEALRRRGLPDDAMSRSTWEQLRSRHEAAGSDSGTVVCAIALGRHTLMLADTPRLPGGPLSMATTAVTSSRAPGGDNDGGESEWVMDRNGVTVAHLSGQPPRRRKGLKLPELTQALTEMGSHNALWTSEQEGLELMCRVTGIWPTAADLGGELLGGILATSRPDELEARTPEMPQPAVRPTITLSGDGLSAPVVVVRVDYSDDAAWNGLLETIASLADVEDLVEVHTVTGPAWAGASVDEVLAALPPGSLDAVFIADATAMNTDGYSLLAVSTTIPAPSAEYEPEEGVSREFRAEARAVAGVHANLVVGNLGFEEFSEAANADPGGVLRAAE